MSFTPYRPRAIRLLNLCGPLLGWNAALNPGVLMAAARRKAGGTDFEDSSFLPALEVLCTAIDREAGLHPFGRWIIRNRLTGILVTRLRVEALLREHPEIRDIEITPPIVVAGLQRTGTTMLHRLLAADPDSRALLSWEAISPLPHARQRAGATDRRIKMAQTAENGLKYLAPEFFRIHPVEAEAPEEDVLLMEYSLLSQVPGATLNIPSYTEWLDEQDMLPAYTYLKTLLQVLHWQRGARRWVLKTPAHLDNLDVLLTVFPQARIIQTHRDPLATTASFSSMLAHGYGVFSDHVDAEAIARRWLQINANMTQRALLVRGQKPDAFLDVSYYELLQDPMQQIERIYAHCSIPLTQQAREAMDAARQANRQNRHGKHSYTLEQFGLSAAEVDQAYASYRQYFDIPYEKGTRA